jgi:hypothetical protein
MTTSNRSVFDDIEPADTVDPHRERSGLSSEQTTADAATAARAVGPHVRGTETRAAHRTHAAGSAGNETVRWATLAAAAPVPVPRRFLGVAAVLVIALAGLAAWRPWEVEWPAQALAVPSAGRLSADAERSANSGRADVDGPAQSPTIPLAREYSAVASPATTALLATAAAPSDVGAVLPAPSLTLPVQAKDHPGPHSERVAGAPARAPDTNSALDAVARADRAARVGARARAAVSDVPRKAGVPSRSVAPPVRSPLAVAATATCTLRGRVADSKGAFLTTARVSIVALGGSTLTRTVETNADGAFAAELPSGGRVRVSVRARGHRESVVETGSCSALPTFLLKRGNPFSSLLDRVRRTDRKIGDELQGK